MPHAAQTRLPISVVIPTRNSMDRLPQHLALHEPLYAQCTEIIHCDSFSEDQTKSFLASRVQHPGLQQVDHPPGLYQSWNYAIQQCTQPYIYFSTVGDSITSEGLQKLFALAEQTKADVVISPPRYIEEAGHVNLSLRWPIDHLIANHQVTSPGLIPIAPLIAEAILHAPDGILGSSASCLYRASFLKPRPFPTEFHGACDSVWALNYLPAARVALLPEKISTFLLHPKTYESHEMLNHQISIMVRQKIIPLLRKNSSDRGASLLSPGPIHSGLIRSLREYNAVGLLHLRQEKTLMAIRKSQRKPWFLSPRAWNARLRRDHYRKLLPSITANVRAALSDLAR